MGIKRVKKISTTKENTTENCTAAIKKYPLVGNVDPKVVFNFPYLEDENTISYVKNHGRVMFIIRGPPFTKKTQLSNLIQKTYPNAVYCSAVKYLDAIFTETQNYDERSAIMASMDKCVKMVKAACERDSPTIIVQNSHIRRFEMEHFLKCAAEYDYTVIMSITTYRFDITLEALKTKKLDVIYLKRRIDAWEDVIPVFTGWFLSEKDSDYMRSFTLKTLKAMATNVEFSKQFSADDVENYFQPRKVLCCLAGSTNDPVEMNRYYFSDIVQTSYGKSFELKLVGYLITNSDVFGIIQLSKEMNCLTLSDDARNSDTKPTNENLRCLVQHGKTTKFAEEDNKPLGTIITMEPWRLKEEIDIDTCSFIHIAQKGFNMFDVRNSKKTVYESLKLVSDSKIIQPDNLFALQNGNTKYCQLPSNAWFVRVSKKLCMNSLFTGFYEG